MGRSIKCEVGQIIIDLDAPSQQVWVDEKHGSRQIRLVVGTVEAVAMRRVLEGSAPERPLTHELLDAVVRGLGGTVDRVEITELRGDTFHARLVLLDVDGREIPLEARPSDSLVLALRWNAPVYVDDRVFAATG